MPDTPVGADSPDYGPLTSADLGATIYCKVTATNASGTANADSNTVGPVTAAPGVGFTYLIDTEASHDDAITTTAIDTTGAGLLVVALSDYSTVATLTDSKGNTWTTTPGSAGQTLRLAYCKPTTVGTGHTISIGGGPSIYAAVCFMAFVGGASSPFDQEVAYSNTGGSGTILPNQNNSLIISMATIEDASSGAYSVGSSFTKICDIQRAGTFGLGVGYLLQTTAAAVNPVWTLPGAATWTVGNFVFK